MYVLHEMPVFTRDAIRAAIPVPPPVTLPNGLTAANLADQIEQIKITPQPMSVEEISKIWSALHTQYRPTAVYKASVVLIQSTRPRRPTVPVRIRNLRVQTFEQPQIDAIRSQEDDLAPIVAHQQILTGYNLVIDGRRLRAPTTRVLIDAVEIIPPPDNVTATQIIIALPPGLQPGLHSVQVLQPVDFGTASPDEPHRGVQSNVASFILSPQITTVLPVSIAPNSTLTLAIDPPVGKSQNVALLAGQRTIPIPPRDPTGPDTTTLLDFAIPGDMPAGPHLLRVQIDGAESPLSVNNAGNIVGPELIIT
jgi:hypothetical protein